MTIYQPTEPFTARPDTAAASEATRTSTAGKALAALRISTGFLFLWAFLDKTFGLHYATPTAKAWIHGGSPTNGFLQGVAVGPFQGTAHAIAGTWWADWLFMLGLLGIGVALMAGIAVRIAAVSGVVMLAGMYLATFPLAQFDATGAATSSTNPIVDEHLTEALVLIVLAATYAGTTWGAGRIWARLPFVKEHRWAL